MSTISAKIPPYNIEAEQSVLGCMLLDRDTVDVAIEALSPEDFYSEQNKWVFEAVIQVYRQGNPIDVITLSNILKDKDVLDKMGGIGYLTQLVNVVPSTANIESYCEIVSDKSTLRQMIRGLSGIVNDCYKVEKSTQAMMEESERFIYDLAMRKAKSHFISLGDALDRTVTNIQEMEEIDSEIIGVPTGFKDLDRITAGFQRSDFILIAARPSMGKTAFALNIAQHAAIREKKLVAIFSLEMSAAQLTTRILSSEAQINSRKLQLATLNDSEWSRITKTWSDLVDKHIYIDDTSGITVNEIKSKCRRLKVEKGLDMVIVDYLQLMNSASKVENRQQEIATISRELKNLAKELDCPMVALSQLSRAPDARTDHRPMLSDLRESGAIEQDADMVLMMFRESYYNKENDSKVTEINIAKHRNGPTGMVELTFLNQYTKFVDHSKIKD